MTNQEAIEIINNFIIDTGEFDYNSTLFEALEKVMNAFKFVDEMKIKIAELEIQIMELNNEIEEWKERD